MHLPLLPPHGTLALVSPACWVAEDDLIRMEQGLRALGWNVHVHPQNHLRQGVLAGSDSERATALMEAFVDPNVDGIMAARGGMGGLFLLPHLDMDIVCAHPKPFVGFSDITVLLHAITSKAGFATYHGAMGWTFVASDTQPRTLVCLRDVLTGTCRAITVEANGVRGGQAQGVLTGGNIKRLQSLIGTPWDWSANGAILFLEDVNEVLYRLDQVLAHFALAGKFKGVRAVLIGEMTRIGDGETGYARAGERPYGISWREIVEKWVPPHIPLAFDVPCGHGGHLITLPIGVPATVMVEDREVRLKW